MSVSPGRTSACICALLAALGLAGSVAAVPLARAVAPPPATSAPAATAAAAAAPTATTTPVVPTAPAPGTAAPARAQASGSRASTGGRPLATAAIVIIALAALLVLGCLAWALARNRAFEPRWLLSLRHATAEAGFRASATWSELIDWMRLGH